MSPFQRFSLPRRRGCSRPTQAVPIRRQQCPLMPTSAVCPAGPGPAHKAAIQRARLGVRTVGSPPTRSTGLLGAVSLRSSRSDASNGAPDQKAIFVPARLFWLRAMRCAVILTGAAQLWAVKSNEVMATSVSYASSR